MTRGNMFNLEQAIAEWRQQLRGAGVKDPARLDELESQIVVVVLWLMMPATAFGGISYGLGEAARRKTGKVAN